MPACAAVIDRVQIGDISAMRAEVWEPWLAKGYAAEFPEEARQILEGIREGVAVDYHGDRSMSRTCKEKEETDEFSRAEVEKILADDLARVRKLGPFDMPPFTVFSVSPVRAVPKKDRHGYMTKRRVIHNLSYPRHLRTSVNDGIREQYQPLGSVQEAMDFIREYGRGCWLVKMDVEAAYKQVPVRPADWPLLGFTWKGKYYFEVTLPFGLRSSCRLWELYATALHYFIERHIGVDMVVHYIDDFLMVFRTKEEAESKLAATLRMCAALRIPMAEDKNELAQRLVFLGIILDTLTMTAALDPRKLEELVRDLSVWEARDRATLKERQSLTGSLNWALQVVRAGRPFLQRLLREQKNISSRRLRAEVQIPLTEEERKDIRWWAKNMRKHNGVSLFYEKEWRDEHRRVLWTDACKRGYGAMWAPIDADGARAAPRCLRGEWSPEVLAEARAGNKTGLDGEVVLSMPMLELRALVLAANTWGRQWAGWKVLFYTDCRPVFQAGERMRSNSEKLAPLMRELASIAAQCGFEFQVGWLAGADNKEADLLSRGDVTGFRALPGMQDAVEDQAAPLPPTAEM